MVFNEDRALTSLICLDNQRIQVVDNLIMDNIIKFLSKYNWGWDLKILLNTIYEVLIRPRMDESTILFNFTE